MIRPRLRLGRPALPSRPTIFIPRRPARLAKFECLLDVLVDLLQAKYCCDRHVAEEEVNRFLADNPRGP